MRPFAGAAFAANKLSQERAPLKASRDISGYTVALRMALYTTQLVSNQHFYLMSHEIRVELVYLLLVTAELASDQIDLAEDSQIFESHSDPKALAAVRDLYSECQTFPAATIHDAASADFFLTRDLIDGMISKFLAVTSTATPTAFYAAKALSHFLPKLEEMRAWRETATEQWLAGLGVLTASTSNILGAVAILTGLHDSLSSTKIVNNLCNRLISNLAGASAQDVKTMDLLILLNACLAVYDDGDLPIAQNRIVFAVQQVLSWTPTLATTDHQLASEACHTLQLLLPAMEGIYGSYWEATLHFCMSIWNSVQYELTPEFIPMVGMALKLFTILRNLENANDDLEDALIVSNKQITQCLIELLKLRRFRENLPLELVDELLCRNVKKLSISDSRDLLDFYPLLASEFRSIQSAAFDVLNKALPAAQQNISVDVLLEKTGGCSYPYIHLSLLTVS